jgi:NADPH:quinone reductase-like Zn-dependent oxidoreductase
MKAAQINQYGGPDVIHVAENAPKPILSKGHLLVENYSTSINAIDWKVKAGYLEKMAPLQFPITLGGDFAGIVVEIGEDVSDFNVGDEVYGQAIVLNGGSGSMAEYISVKNSTSAIKPKSISFEEASALPLAGVSALQAIEEHINLKNSQKILIHGGAGGVGHFAIQLAKSLGAHVATTANAEDSDFVKSLGADEVIDYKTQKFEEILKDYDAVFDTVGGEVTDKSFGILKNGGIIVSMAGQPNPELAEKYGVTAIGQFTKTNTKNLNRLTELVDSGKIKAHIDKTFTLDHVSEAFTYQEKIHPQGKVVVRIE